MPHKFSYSPIHTYEQVSQIIRQWIESGAKEAMILNGPWGSGKTWFIENTLRNEIHEKKKIARISLFGLNRSSQITEEIFYQTADNTQLFARKFGNLIQRASFGLIPTGKKNQNNEAPSNISLQINTDIPGVRIGDLHGYILVLDDIERCKIEPTILAGYINNLVEKNEANLIIVGNFIDWDAVDEALIHIEKFANTIVHVEAEIKEFIPSLNLLRPESIQDYIEFFQLANIENLRTIQNAIQNVEIVAGLFEEIIDLDSKNIRRLKKELAFIETQIIKIEFNKNSLLKSYLSDLLDDTSTESNDSTELVLHDLLNNLNLDSNRISFLGYNQSNSVQKGLMNEVWASTLTDIFDERRYDFLFRIRLYIEALTYGSLQKETVLEQWSESPGNLAFTAEKDWVLIYRLPNSDISGWNVKNIDDVVGRFRSDEFELELENLFEVVHFMNAEKLLVNIELLERDDVNIVEKYQCAIEKYIRKLSVVDISHLRFVDGTGVLGHGYYFDGTKFCDDILKLLHKRVEKEFVVRTKKNASKYIIEQISDLSVSMSSILGDFVVVNAGNQFYLDTPVLADLDVKSFARSVMLRRIPEILDFLFGIGRRYTEQRTEAKELFDQEKGFWRDLAKEIASMSNDEPVYRKAQFVHLSRRVGLIAEYGDIRLGIRAQTKDS